MEAKLRLLELTADDLCPLVVSLPSVFGEGYS